MRTPGCKPESIDKARQSSNGNRTTWPDCLTICWTSPRITRGGIELRKEDIDLRDVIRTAIEALTPVLEERQAKLTIQIPESVLSVRGDTARIQQVIVNLLSNAARYSPPGSPIVLSAEPENDWIVLEGQRSGPRDIAINAVGHF